MSAVLATFTSGDRVFLPYDFSKAIVQIFSNEHDAVLVIDMVRNALYRTREANSHQFAIDNTLH